MAPRLPKALGKTWTEAFVRLGYGDIFGFPTRSLHWKTQDSNPVDVADIIEPIDYNEFEGAMVAHTLRQWGSEGIVSSVEFGREYSPVLYIRMHRDAPEGARDALMEVLRSPHMLKADEVDVETGGVVRAWWD